MRNRYGDQYEFVQLDENTYTVTGELKFWQYGGKEGQQYVDESDLQFVDPSGGPFIDIGYPINGRPVTHISAVNGEFKFTVA